MVHIYDYSLQYCPDTGRSTGEYIIFYQGFPIDRGIHLSGPIAKSSEKSE